ncbi:hypothetical protein GHY86_00585 [Vibrio alginolyticus]|uniref:Uncharacterized protein n=1 Tax=Vibrio alginolyticus TaxID=663 RepID=A0AA36XNZ1_VIBAL|nr:hypothetical protein [Vibrio alginolyticus]
MFQWSSQNSLSQSKLVKSSSLWFVLVPVFAKVLDGFNGKLSFTFDGTKYELTLMLPFSWQLLFFASLFFMIAGFIYQAKCNEIIKRYSSYSDFKSEGNTRLQINKHLKSVVWDNEQAKVRPSYADVLDSYIDNYTSINSSTLNNNTDYLPALDNLSKSKGEDSNAFYFVYNISNTNNKNWLKASLAFYIIGFICLLMIAISNISFVIKSMY